MHVITGLEQGGAEAMLVRLLRGLDRESFSQSVVSLTTRGIYGDLVESYGIPLTTLGMAGFASMPGCLVGLGRDVNAFRPDIVQTWLYHADLMGLLASRWASSHASVVWNIRCSSLEPGDVPSSTRWLRWCLTRLSSRPEAVLFNSVAGQSAHHAIGYRPRHSLVLPNGFDLERWRPNSLKRMEFRAEIGVGDDTILVGMVARYHRIKGHKAFFAAAARLRNSIPGIRFVLAGSGITWSNNSLVADIDRLDLKDIVILLGSRTDMPRIMAGLDCLVSTSTSEGFPNVLGEAMACGVPCVATDAGDSRNMVGDTGKIVALGDVDGLVIAVAELMTAGAEEKGVRSMQCRERIAENFELGQVVHRYAHFYRELYASRQ